MVFKKTYRGFTALREVALFEKEELQFCKITLKKNIPLTSPIIISTVRFSLMCTSNKKVHDQLRSLEICLSCSEFQIFFLLELTGLREK